MIDTERREAARQFINRWRGKGKEDEDGRSYWIELLSNILNISVYSFDRYKKKTVNMLTLEQICILRSHLNITFNELLGEQVFTPDNIDNQTDNTKHTSLSDNLVIIEENEIHLHPKFAEAIRKAIQDNKE